MIFNRDAARHVATNALPPYAHARPTATVCAYHAHPTCLPPETLWFLQRRGAPRRDKKTHVSPRGMVYAWRRWQWAAFGRNADRNADCRDGVFAVPREDSPAHRHPPPCAQAAPMKPPWPLWRRGVPRRYPPTPFPLMSAGVNDGRWQCPAMPTVGAGSSRFLAKIPPPTAPHRCPAPRRYKSQDPSSTLVGGARCAIGQVDDAAIAEARIQQKPYRVVIQRVRIGP